MHPVVCSLNTSLDGFINDADGGLEWSIPDDDVFRFAIDEVSGLHTHVLGRKLYEAMLYWDDPEVLPTLDEAEREFAGIWNALPKVVFSHTLDEVRGNARLATDGLADEIARLRAEPGEGEIAIGGAVLGGEAAALDLIDEYRVRIHPVLVGGGLPLFARLARRVDLSLVETRTFDSGVVYLRYRVVR